MVSTEAPADLPDPYDGPWKLGIDDFLPYLMAFLFPASYAEIDWSRPYRPLNAELEGILPAEENATRRIADTLYQVWRLDGREQWIILHLEVQSQPDPDLPRRMWVYAYRCFEKYGTEVFGFVILGDANPAFRPGPYVWQLGEAGLTYRYEAAKLIDYRLEELEASDNPAAIMILSHRYTRETKGDPEKRRHFKLRLTRLLFRKGYDLPRIRSLFKILDWMLRLDREQAIIFRQEAKALREEPEMDTYVNTFEWIAREEGMEKGREEGKQLGREEGKQLGREEGKQLGREEGKQLGVERVLRAQLVRRFGELPAWVANRLAAASAETLEAWSLRLLDAHSLEEVFA